MENLAAIFFASLGIGLTGAVMPGPLLALTLKESLSRGKWSALWLSGGHSCCELVMVTALAAGVSRLVPVNVITGPVGILGGAILFWMGIGAMKETHGETNLPDDTASGAADGHGLLLSGAAVTVTNPYWTIWWLTAGLALVLFAGKAGLAGIIAFYVGHISADFLWFGLVGVVVGSGRRILQGNLYHRMLQACGVLLLLFGLLFVGYGGRQIYSAFLQ